MSCFSQKNQHISATSTPKSMWVIQVCKIHLLSMKVKHIAFYTAARNLPFLFTHHWLPYFTRLICLVHPTPLFVGLIDGTRVRYDNTRRLGNPKTEETLWVILFNQWNVSRYCILSLASHPPNCNVDVLWSSRFSQNSTILLFTPSAKGLNYRSIRIENSLNSNSNRQRVSKR